MKHSKNPIPGFLHNFEQYGDTYRAYLGGIQPMLVTKDPDIVRHVLQKNHRNYIKTPMIFEKLRRFLGNGLLTSEGPYWLQQRRLIQPGFHKQRLQALVEIMNQVIAETEPKGLVQAGESQAVDVYPMMMRLAFDLVTRSLFSTAVSAEKLELLSHSLTTIQAFLVQQIRQPYLNPWFKISGQLSKHIKLGKAADEILLKMIRNRRSSGASQEDLLQMLLDARYEDTGEGMTDQQLLEETNILITAGHETSANALSWIFYLLAKHPAKQALLRTELQEVLGTTQPTFAHLPRLRYTTQVIEEAMRLYPPAWVTDRQSAKADEIKGHQIPEGTMVVLAIYALHHDPKFWDKPEAFQPERFAPETRKQRISNYSYLPFGGGPRLCIGNSFAMMEMQLVLVHYLRKYRIELATEKSPELLPLVTLRPKNGVSIFFEEIA
ncbi:MAG: cytochrome P450 [Saprospiraceae bacterium]|nr:cytochrome P450 [Saprospiraceae bacterium]